VERILSIGRVSCGKGTYSPSFKYPPMRGGQVTKKAKRRSSHVAPTLSGV